MLNSLLPSSEMLKSSPLKVNREVDDKVEDLPTKNYFSSMPTEDDLQEVFAKSFVINQPMDQVGGDGFWVHSNSTHAILVVFDCMGHGRMATIMTSQYLKYLDEVIVDGGEADPAAILQQVHNKFKEQYSEKEHLLGTGADMGIISYNKKTSKAVYCGAKIDLYQVTDGQVDRLRGSRIAIGEYFHKERAYESTELNLKKVSHFYMMSDGITDLFGGPRDKKFGTKNLMSLLECSNVLDEAEEKVQIIAALNRWNSKNLPTDDMLMVSIRTPFGQWEPKKDISKEQPRYEGYW